MKRKVIKLRLMFVVLAVVCAFAFVLAACNNGEHTHDFEGSTEFKQPITAEGHQAKCKTCDEYDTIKPHEYGNDNVCDICGYEKEAEHTHDFEGSTVFKQPITAEGHQAKCKTCDEYDSLKPHEYGNDDVCDVCGYKKEAEVPPEHEHDFEGSTVFKQPITAEGHQAKCKTCDEYDSLKPHEYGNDDVCDVCGYKKETETPPEPLEHEHNYEGSTVFKQPITSEGHQRKCTVENCDVYEDIQEHVYGNDEFCDVCNYHEHKFEGEYKIVENGHQRKCTLCDEYGTVENHVYGDDGFCACGAKRPEDHNHTYAWKYDSTNHWHECTVDGCYEKSDTPAPHVLTEVVEKRVEPTCSKPGSKTLVCECGYETTEPIEKKDHEYSAEWKFDANNHWHECKNCGTPDMKSAHIYNGGNVCEVCKYEKTADDEPQEEIEYTLEYTFDEANKQATLVGYTAEASGFHMVIPRTVIHNNEPYTVVAIAFESIIVQNRIFPASIRMEDNIVSLGYNTFSGQGWLTELILSNKIVDVGDYAFDGMGDRQGLTVYYLGNAAEFTALLGYNPNCNWSDENKVVYYYSEDESELYNTWHFDDNGDPVLWNEPIVLPAKLSGEYIHEETDQSITIIGNNFACYTGPVLQSSYMVTDYTQDGDIYTLTLKTTSGRETTATFNSKENTIDLGGIHYVSENTLYTPVPDNYIATSYHVWYSDGHGGWVDCESNNPLDKELKVPIRPTIQIYQDPATEEWLFVFEDKYIYGDASREEVAPTVDTSYYTIYNYIPETHVIQLKDENGSKTDPEYNNMLYEAKWICYPEANYYYVEIIHIRGGKYSANKENNTPGQEFWGILGPQRDPTVERKPIQVSAKTVPSDVEGTYTSLVNFGSVVISGSKFTYTDKNGAVTEFTIVGIESMPNGLRLLSIVLTDKLSGNVYEEDLTDVTWLPKGDSMSTDPTTPFISFNYGQGGDPRYVKA